MAGLNESPIEEPRIFMLPGGRMDTKNAAIYLGRSVKTLAGWRSQGVGPRYSKIGRVVYYREDLDTWLTEAGRVVSTSQARER